MVRFGGARQDRYDAGTPTDILKRQASMVLNHIGLYKDLAGIMNDLAFLIANNRFDDISGHERESWQYKVKEIRDSANRLAEELKISTSYLNTERAINTYNELRKMTPSQVAGNWDTTATPLMMKVYRAGYDDAKYLLGKILGY